MPRAARSASASPPTPGSTIGDMHAGGHVRKRAREHERALEHVLRRDPVRDVDHLDIGRDALDHAATRSGEVVLEAEIGQEGDELACDAASLTAATRPSRSWLSASATTFSPTSRASCDVTGPMLTHGRSVRSAASARRRGRSDHDEVGVGERLPGQFDGAVERTSSAPSSRTSTSRAPSAAACSTRPVGGEAPLRALPGSSARRRGPARCRGPAAPRRSPGRSPRHGRLAHQPPQSGSTAFRLVTRIQS